MNRITKLKLNLGDPELRIAALKLTIKDMKAQGIKGLVLRDYEKQLNVLIKNKPENDKKC